MTSKKYLKIHFLVEGRVQNVGFRRFAKNTAKQLSLSGWVKNLSTGQVEINAVGREEKINLFVKKIKNGNFLSVVKKISIISKNYLCKNSIGFNFRILKTNR
jgi:acylphosphatase